MAFRWKEGNVSSECPKCEAKNLINPSDFSVESTSYPKGDDQMGDEIHHHTDIEVRCVNCENDYSSWATIFEYPNGLLEDVDCSSDLDESDIRSLADVYLD